LHLLEKYAEYLYDQGFVVTFGSEHNTPATEPISLSTRNGIPLSEKIEKNQLRRCMRNCCSSALVKQGLRGFVDENGLPIVQT
jgi:hypothetical protein